MITRKEYLDKRATHREFYAQFVDDQVKRNVINHIGLNAIKASKDDHFNDIPLFEWDAIWNKGVPARVVRKLREALDYPTLATSVCILKEAARQIVESHNA